MKELLLLIKEDAMRNLIKLLYSVTAGLEQALVTFDTITRAEHIQATLPVPKQMKQRQIGFAVHREETQSET